MSNRFYMMCSRETVGNNASFHCHNGNGYSSNIDRAHVYTLEEAQKAWNCGRDIDQPVCADSVDAMAVWHVDCQYIPTESLIEPDCTAYVAYKKVAGTATMFTGFNMVDCQQMTSVKRPSLASPTKTNQNSLVAIFHC